MDTELYHNKAESGPQPVHSDADAGADSRDRPDGRDDPVPKGVVTIAAASVDSSILESTGRTTLKRHPERGRHALAEVYGILDEGFVCHVGLAGELGPVVIPTSYGRAGDHLYLHGSPASRLLRGLKAGVSVCVTVTLIDGLVLARSTFHHSMNFRSVVIFGSATEVTDPDEKAAALQAIVEHIVPGRTAEARPASLRELKATLVLALPIAEASAKVRAGGPVEDPEDLDRPMWAGVLPLATVMGVPRPDAYTSDGQEIPDYITAYCR